MNHEERVVSRVDFALIVTSDKVFEGIVEDRITPMVKELLAQNPKFMLVYNTILPNNYEAIREKTIEALGKADVVIVTGGTGFGSKDLVVRVVDSLEGYDVPGFGELFRMLSWEQVGAKAWLSRAKARVIGGKVVFVLPGSPNAVRLALEKLILPVIDHMLWELRH